MPDPPDKDDPLFIEENVRERRFDVDQNFDGWRLDRFLANRIGRISRSFAGKIAREGSVEVIPDRKVKAGTRLRNRDVVIVREQLEPERVQDDEVAILHHDDALLVVDKPAGMLVHESSTIRLNTVDKFLERQGFDEAEPVHRIDRETSGIVVCAARRELVPELRGLFATDHPEKIYRALVLDPRHRWSVGSRETIEHHLGLVEDGVLDLRMGRGELGATTHVSTRRRLETDFGPMADLEIRIETGRQHQIRVHLALEGTPIAGDKLYTFDDAFFIAICARPDDPELLAKLPFERHALHAWRIELPHPDSGDTFEAEAPLPQLWVSDDSQ
jgi:23S rRNA pseudouridine1911/1915/1917 synthase